MLKIHFCNVEIYHISRNLAIEKREINIKNNLQHHSNVELKVIIMNKLS